MVARIESPHADHIIDLILIVVYLPCTKTGRRLGLWFNNHLATQSRTRATFLFSATNSCCQRTGALGPAVVAWIAVCSWEMRGDSRVG